MAALSLNSNLPALQAARSLQTATTDVSSLYERLSSGTRINHASDDPAGLAEASTLSTAGRVYTQATRNVNDSISFFNVADAPPRRSRTFSIVWVSLPHKPRMAC